MIGLGDANLDEIHDKFAFFMMDGCRHGNESTLISAFKKKSGSKAMQKDNHLLYFAYEQKSLEERRERIRTMLDQVEFCHVVTKDSLVLPELDRLEFPGTTWGNHIGPIILPPRSSLWSLPLREKKLLYGQGARIDVGGRTPGLSEEDARKMKKRQDDDIEPVCYHSIPKKLLSELTHSLNIKAWINLVGNDGTLEEVCLEKRIPCVTWCFTDFHVEALRTHLTKRVFAMYQDEESELKDVRLMTLLGNKVGSKKKGDEEPKPPKKKSNKKDGKSPSKTKDKVTGKSSGGKPKAKSGKPKQKSVLDKLKKLQAAAEDDDEEEEEEEEEVDDEEEEDSADE